MNTVALSDTLPHVLAVLLSSLSNHFCACNTLHIDLTFSLQLHRHFTLYPMAQTHVALKFIAYKRHFDGVDVSHSLHITYRWTFLNSTGRVAAEWKQKRRDGFQKMSSLSTSSARSWRGWLQGPHRKSSGLSSVFSSELPPCPTIMRSTGPTWCWASAWPSWEMSPSI